MSSKLQEKERLDRQIMAFRVAKEFKDGDIVNLNRHPRLGGELCPCGQRGNISQ